MSARRSFAAVVALVACFMAALAVRAADPDVETSVHESHVAPGDPITLQIRLRGAAAASQPDLAPLARDFEVLDVHQTHRTSIVNGVRDESVDYLVALSARREGELVIPALAVGDTTTDPVPIHVSGRASGDGHGDDEPEVAANPIVLDAYVDRSDPYEQERIILNVELLAAGEVLEGALSAPEIAGAVVEPIGEDRRIEKEIGGKQYAGIERTYTVVPEKSGDLEVPSIRFEGRVRVPRPRPQTRSFGSGYGHSLLEDFFAHSLTPDDLLGGFFGETRRVAENSKPLKLRVRPRPEAAAGHWWLPAHAVSISERWDPANASVRVGEPVTRRIELRADGASPAQLPPFASHDVEGAKQYAEAPKINETIKGAVRVDETTIIPTQPGSVMLPAVEVTWWDTKADALRTASLPPRTIEVLAAFGGNGPPPGKGTAPAPTAANAPSATDDAFARSAFFARADPRVLAAFAIVAAIGIFFLGVLAARSRNRHAAPTEAPPPSSPTRRSAERALRRACRRNDVVAAETAVRTLRRVAGADAIPAGDGALAEEIARLHAVRYSTRTEAWSGAALWKAWRRARKARRPAAGVKALPPLYPTS